MNKIKKLIKECCVIKWMHHQINELSVPLSILISSLVAIFSVLYASNLETFYKSNEVIIILLEISSATFAYLIYILDRIGALNNSPKWLKTATNCITVMFFLITIPHLLADSIEKLSLHRNALIFSLIFPALIVFLSFCFVLKEIFKYSFIKTVIYSIVILFSILAILYILLPMIYGSLI